MAQSYKALTEVLFSEIIKRLIELGIEYKFDRSMMKITYGSGAIFGFSYENIEAVRGLTEISIAVCDEAALSPSNLFSTLSPCLRGEGIEPYIRLLSTPRKGSWINLYVKEHPDSVQVIQARTIDNPLITEEQLKLMQSAIVNKDLIEQELEGKMLDIDSDSSILQLRDYPHRDSGYDGQHYMGMDLAGLGSDCNVLTVVSKYRIEEQISIRVADTFELSDAAEKMYRRWDVQCLDIDITGSTSCGVLDVLRAKGLKVNGINFAQKPYDNDTGKRCANARAEMYVDLSNAVKGGLYIQDDDIKTQLAYTTIFVNQSGKLQLVKKDEIKEMIGHSPDQADSLALAVYAMMHSESVPTVEEERKKASEVANRYMSMYHLYND